MYITYKKYECGVVVQLVARVLDNNRSIHPACLMVWYKGASTIMFSQRFLIYLVWCVPQSYCVYYYLSISHKFKLYYDDCEWLSEKHDKTQIIGKHWFFVCLAGYFCWLAPHLCRHIMIILSAWSIKTCLFVININITLNRLDTNINLLLNID